MAWSSESPGTLIPFHVMRMVAMRSNVSSSASASKRSLAGPGRPEVKAMSIDFGSIPTRVAAERAGHDSAQRGAHSQHHAPHRPEQERAPGQLGVVTGQVGDAGLGRCRRR